MKVKVTLLVGATTFEEVVYVGKFEDTKKTVLARNPSSKVFAIKPIP